MRLLPLLLSTCTSTWDKTIRIFGGDANMEASYSINPTEGSIAIKSNSMPKNGRIYHTVIQYKGDVFLIGGQPGRNGGSDGAKSKGLRTVFVENKGLTGELWNTGPLMNTARARHATAIYNDLIWVCGGRGGNGFNSLLSCETFDGRDWTKAAGMIGTTGQGVQQGRDRFALISTDNGLMAIGGHNSFARSAQKSTEIYTANTGWLPGPTMPYNRFGHKALAYENRIYVFGGTSNEDEAEILKLDTFKSEWTMIGKLANPIRMKFIALQSDNQAFIYGGKCEKASGTSGKTWEACNPMAEVFDFITEQTSNFTAITLPGNLEAAGIVLDADPVVSPLQGQRTSRAFKANVDLSSFFDNYEDITNETVSVDETVSGSPQILQDFIIDDAPLEDISYEEEQEEDALFEANLTDDSIDTSVDNDDDDDEDAAFETSVKLESDSDQDKDGRDELESAFEINLAPTFSLQGNLSEIVSTITRRYGEPANEIERQKLSLAVESVPQNTIVAEERVGFAPFARSRNMNDMNLQAAQRRVTINGEQVIFARTEFQCWSCSGRTAAECAENAVPEVCPSSQQTCIIYQEKQNGREIAFRSGCSNENVCVNQKRQNYVGETFESLYKINQCRPQSSRGSSTCRQCCATTLCNDPNDYGTPAFDWVN